MPTPKAPRLRAPAIAALAGFLVLACGDGKTPKQKEPKVEPPPQSVATAAPVDPPTSLVTEITVNEDPTSGPGIYKFRCSGCHGMTGDGKGETKLETPARSFQEGRFAFGDTREAIFRTITSGVPGRSKMAGFGDVLSEEERWKVVDHVLTLMPAKKPVSDAETRIEVKQQPVVVRGMLDAIANGVPHRPRGLLVGYPGGMSFEYRTDDVRLLGVRQGEFVKRTDWDGRGGTPLKVLGNVVLLAGGGNPEAPFSVVAGGRRAALAANFTGTWIHEKTAGLSYRLENEEGRALAKVEESHRIESCSIGLAFTRQFTLTSRNDAASETFVLDATGADKSAAWTAGYPEATKPELGLEVAPIDPKGWIARKDGSGTQTAWRIAAPAAARVVKDANALLVALALEPKAQAVVEFTCVLATQDLNAETLAKLAKEMVK